MCLEYGTGPKFVHRERPQIRPISRVVDRERTPSAGPATSKKAARLGSSAERPPQRRPALL